MTLPLNFDYQKYPVMTFVCPARAAGSGTVGAARPEM